MPATDRLGDEITFHDEQARARAGCLRADERLRFRDDDYLDHETWIRPAFALLGEVRGLDVLDFGCGHGMAGVVLARRGARVTGLDLSSGYLLEAARRARANGVSLGLVRADGERLPFADGSFDRVWGNAVLHHLDPRRGAGEVRRVLRPGGWAVFCEPWGGNPLLEAARRWLPYPAKRRTPGERPLRPDHLAQLRLLFPGLRVEGHQLLGMARRVLGPGRLADRLQCWDAGLLPRYPSLWQLCRYVVLTLRPDLHEGEAHPPRAATGCPRSGAGPH